MRGINVVRVPRRALDARELLGERGVRNGALRLALAKITTVIIAAAKQNAVE
jgi:hypothetical protein